MKEGKLNSELILGPGIAVIVILFGIGAYLFYRQPLGPALETPSSSEPRSTEISLATTVSEVAVLPEAASTSEATEWVVTTIPPTPTSDQSIAPAATAARKVVCGENEAWNVLVLGSDAADLYYPQGSDLTRVLRVDFPNKEVSVFALSRDLLVDASELGFQNPDITTTRLGMVFYEARRRSNEPDTKDSMQAGVNAIARTLAVNFDLQFDHYIALDLDRFPAMIDTVGGVPIDIPVALTDPKSGVAFHTGPQTLDGEQTAIYARAYLGSDLQRIERNDLLIEALRQKLLDPAVWIKVPRLFIQFREAINSDLSLEQVNHLVCLLKEVEEDAIIQEGVLEAWTTPGPDSDLIWDEAKVLARLEELGMVP
jgi:LCP family protein required for cell wall assembly